MALYGEVRKAKKYYVVSRPSSLIKMCDNLLLLLFIWDILWQSSES